MTSPTTPPYEASLARLRRIVEHDQLPDGRGAALWYLLGQVEGELRALCPPPGPELTEDELLALVAPLATYKDSDEWEETFASYVETCVRREDDPYAKIAGFTRCYIDGVMMRARSRDEEVAVHYAVVKATPYRKG